MTGLPARQYQARMDLQAEAPAVRRNHQQFSACRVHTPQRRPRPFHQRHVRVSCLEIWNCLGVSAHCAAGLSGCAPCRLRCHGHSASIPHAFAPAALRASLASRGKPCGLSPPRDAWRPSMPPNRLRRIGPASAPPRWTVHWRTRWSLLRQVVQMRALPNAGGSCPSRHEGRFTDIPPGIAMELPRHASRPAPQGAAGAFSLVVGWLTWPASVGEPVLPSCGDAEPALPPFDAVRPKASLCCCES